MYEEYIKSEKTPAGKVLEHILRKAKITQKQLSIKAGVYPQRISELIKGTRDFTIQQSIAIEIAFNTYSQCFFYGDGLLNREIPCAFD